MKLPAGVTTVVIASTTNPNRMYLLTEQDGAFACTCPGYRHRGTCKHVRTARAVRLQQRQPLLTREQAIHAVEVGELEGVLSETRGHVAVALEHLEAANVDNDLVELAKGQLRQALGRTR